MFGLSIQQQQHTCGDSERSHDLAAPNEVEFDQGHDTGKDEPDRQYARTPCLWKSKGHVSLSFEVIIKKVPEGLNFDQSYKMVKK